VAELTEMLSRSLVVSRTLGDELERNFSTIVAKLKAELNESSSSLKVTLEAMWPLDEKHRQVSIEDYEEKNKLATLAKEVQAERADRLKVEKEATIEKKTLTEKLEYYESFLLRISKQCFFPRYTSSCILPWGPL